MSEAKKSQGIIRSKSQQRVIFRSPIPMNRIKECTSVAISKPRQKKEEEEEGKKNSYPSSPNRHPFLHHHSPHPIPFSNRTDARFSKIREIRPIAQAGQITADPDPGRRGRRGPIEQPKLEPTGGADIGVGGRSEGASAATAGDSGEEGALAHAVAVSGGFGAEQGEAGGGAGEGADVGDGNLLAVGPVAIGEGVGGAGGAGEEVGRGEGLDAVFLRVLAVLGVGAGHEDAAVLHEERFRVVEARHDRRRQDGHARPHRFGGIVEDGAQVGLGGEAEAGDALLGAVEDQVGAVGQGGDAGHDAARGHALERPLRVGRVGLGEDAVVERDGGARVGAAADEDGEGVRVGGELGQEHGGALEGVGPTGAGLGYGAGLGRQRFDGAEGGGVEDAGFVVVGHEDAAGGEHGEEGVEVVGVGAL